MVKRNPTHTQSIANRANLSPNPTPCEIAEDLLTYDKSVDNCKKTGYSCVHTSKNKENEPADTQQTLISVELTHNSGYAIHVQIFNSPQNNLSNKLDPDDLREALQAMCIQFASESMQESLISILDSDVQVTYR